MSKINSAGKLYDMPDDPRIAQLQAENERLTLADRQWADHVKRLADENERLQANIESLGHEVERLRADQHLLDESVRNRAIRESIHKEELKRLRAALRAGVGTHGEVCHQGEDCQFMRDARAALGSDNCHNSDQVRGQ